MSSIYGKDTRFVVCDVCGSHKIGGHEPDDGRGWFTVSTHPIIVPGPIYYDLCPNCIATVVDLLGKGRKALDRDAALHVANALAEYEKSKLAEVKP